MRFGLLACVLIASAAAPAMAQNAEFERPYWVDRPVIEALGNASVDVQPDHARFSVTFIEVDRNQRDALFKASDRARLAVAAMRSRGGDSVRITSEPEIETIFEEYRNREGERLSSERADQVANYAVSVTLRVDISDIARAEAVRAAAIAVGPEDYDDLRYSLVDTASARLRAYRAAVQDAAARARAASEASGAPLGRLLALQEGAGPCLGRWFADPARRSSSQNAPAPARSADGEDIIVTAARRQEQLTLAAEDIARVQLPDDAGPVTISARVCAIYGAGP